MAAFKYANAVVEVRGEMDQKRIRRATLTFLKKVEVGKRNGNVNSSRVIGTQQVLD